MPNGLPKTSGQPTDANNAGKGPTMKLYID
jgi:hypothetical protein